jgi:hypothetical protein
MGNARAMQDRVCNGSGKNVKGTMPRRVKTQMIPRPSLTSMRSGILQRKCACGSTSRLTDECEECRKKHPLQKTQNPRSGVLNDLSVPRAVHEIIPPSRPLDTEARAFVQPRFGHDFSDVPVYSDARAAEPARDTNARAYTVARGGGVGLGQLASGTKPQTPTPSEQPKSTENPKAPTADTAPTPMDNPPAKGPAITVTNGWANPAGKQDRTTVGIGELSSFVVKDFEGGSWKSDDGNGTTVNSVTFRWTASAAGKNTITYTASDGSTSSVTMTTEVPSKLTGKKDDDLTYPAGTQGAGMDLTVTVQPTTVSFQALELMEETCDASAISGYFTSHTPGPHDAAAGAGKWRGVGTANDVSDTADASDWPSPWSKGSYTWAIPVNWRLKGAKTSTAFAAKNDQVVTITGANGTTIVTKLGAKTSPRKP